MVKIQGLKNDSYKFYIIPISAKSRESLGDKVKDLYWWLTDGGENLLMEQIAYTLGVGRSHFKYRLVFIVQETTELIKKLHTCIQSPSLEDYEKENQKEEKLSALIPQTLADMAKRYQEGEDINFASLYCDKLYRKIPMPTYPFRRETYWARKTTTNPIQKKQEGIRLVKNEAASVFNRQVFDVSLSIEDFYIHDHTVGSRKVLPGVVYLEMGRVAGEMVYPGERVTGFKSIEFKSPMEFDHQRVSYPVQLFLITHGERNYFQVMSYQNGGTILHQTGEILLKERIMDKGERIDLTDIHNRCKKIISGSDCYKEMKERGLVLDKSFQAVMQINKNENEVYGSLKLPKHLLEGFSSFGLHPSLLDGALETVVDLVEDKTFLSLPCGIDEIEILDSLNPECYSYAVNSRDKQEGVRKFHVSIFNPDGKTAVRIKGFALKEMAPFSQENREALLYFHKTLKEANHVQESYSLKNNEVLLYFGIMDDLYRSFRSLFGNQLVLIERGDFYQKSDNAYTIRRDIREDYHKVFKDITEAGLEAKGLIYDWDRDMTTQTEESNVIYPFLLLNQVVEAWNPDLKRIYYYRKHGTSNPYQEGIAAFVKSVNLEKGMPKLQMVVWQEETEESVPESLFAEFTVMEKTFQVPVVYKDGKRNLEVTESVKLLSQSKSLLKNGGIYVITGGQGKLGSLLADEIAKQVDSVIILAGRTGSKEEYRVSGSFGSKIYLKKADVTDFSQMNRLISDIKVQFGGINGVIHGAGIIKDSFLSDKSPEDFQRVLEPKVKGLLVLDEVLKEEPLDFFMTMSSIASITGNAGQCDYAYANCFMDSYLRLRQELVEKGERSGISITVNWPLWQMGGMHIDSQVERYFRETMGILPLKTDTGLKAFSDILKSGYNQYLVIYGLKEKVNGYLNPVIYEEQTKEDNQRMDRETDHLQIVSEILMDMLKLKAGDVDYDRNVNDYGLNSISIIEFTNRINERFGSNLSPSIYYQYGTLKQLAEYMTEQKFSDTKIPDARNTYTNFTEVKQYSSKKQEEYKAALDVEEQSTNSFGEKLEDAIAVIGMSGIMPQSEDLEEFWEKLEAMENLVTEIPSDRWDFDVFNQELCNRGEEPISKWGGFMKAVDKFDAEFFGISPREARVMDPQQRLLLQTVWNTIEDAGYNPKELWDTKTGLFVGVATMDYSDVLRANHTPIEAYSSTGASHCILVNRISYLFNWHGPSEPVDTACSSSLIAIHRAIESIKNGDCELAVAGGVNVITSPMLHLAFSKAGMLSPDGTCMTFDKRANGYVRGEGCGTLLLKSLKKAKKDGDHIYALIKGTAVNHGGKANSLTAPNPKAQAEVITKAWRKAGFAPNSIGYIEAHGTGTNLGDPVEIDGLNLAFREMYKECGQVMPADKYCHIGSVKTNMGHLEAAAGIAGVFKILLSIKHKKLPGNLHLEEINPFIKIEEAPLHILKDTMNWEPLYDQKGSPLPRRAGISSFGFGGANAHIALEEYQEEWEERVYKTESKTESIRLIPLSAKTEEALIKRCQRLLAYLGNHEYEEISLDEIAWTLQTGREPMEERIAVVVRTMNELEEELAAYLEGRPNHVITKARIIDKKSEVTGETLKRLIQQNELYTLANHFVTGGSITWKKLHENTVNKRIALPGYPFSKERHWIIPGTTDFLESFFYTVTDKKKQLTDVAIQRTHNLNPPLNLHPLLDENLSTSDRYCFRKRLHRNAFYLRDHVVNRNILLPGVAYLEIFLAAVRASGWDKVVFTDIAWRKPLIIEQEEMDLYVELLPDKDKLLLEIYTEQKGGKMIHSSCEVNVVQADYEQPECLAVDEIRGRLPYRKDRDECYNIYKRVGFDYGPSFQVTNYILSNEKEGLVELTLNKNSDSKVEGFILHPSLLDGAIRSIACIGGQNHSNTYVPFYLGSLTVYKQIPDTCYAYARIVKDTAASIGAMQFHISVLDEKGQEVAILKNLQVRRLKEKEDEDRTVYMEPVWKEEPLTVNKEGYKTEDKETVILIHQGGGISELFSEIYEKELNTSQVIEVYQGDSFSKQSSQRYTINYKDEKDYTAFFMNLKEEGRNIKAIVHLYDRLNEANNMEDILYKSIHTIRNFSNGWLNVNPEILLRYYFTFLEVKELKNSILQTIPDFAHSLAAVNPKFQLSSVELVDCGEAENGKEAIERSAKLLVMEINQGNHGNGLSIRYVGDKRYMRSLEVVNKGILVSNNDKFRAGGTYLITGGLGKLGFETGKSLAKNYNARLIVIGRSAAEKAAGKLRELESCGSEVIYIQSDFTNKEYLRAEYEKARGTFGQLNGVIHCAGVQGLVPIHEANYEEFQKVLYPKIQGTLLLDELTQRESLDFFLLFSSVSSEIGDLGPCSYAIANGFLNHFAHTRKLLTDKGLRSGMTLSLGWPMWQAGAMKLPEEQALLYTKYYGLEMLSMEEGLAIFYRLVNGAKQSSLLIGSGDEDKIRKTFKIPARREALSGIIPAAVQLSANSDLENNIADNAHQNILEDNSGNMVYEKTREYLRDIISKVSGISVEKIKDDTNFEKFGIDSLMILELNKRLAADFEGLDKTIFFEYSTLRDLTGYFVKEHSERLKNVLPAFTEKKPQPLNQSVTKEKAAVSQCVIKEVLGAVSANSNTYQTGNKIMTDNKPYEINQKLMGNEEIKESDIAIIGINGRYPMAENLEEFWENLKEGKDCISEIPKERWDYIPFYSSKKGTPNKVYSKWGGFLKDVDKFDPLFFKITPKDARFIDPQEKIFLENVFGTLEDAGYGKVRKEPQKVGVFVGVSYGHYQLFGAEESLKGNLLSLSSSYASIANRISYFFNFEGPSLAVDTMCSSSMTALHLACESLKHGECEMAVAGGVNLTLHPDKYIFLSTQRFASSEGKCRAFGEGGDGYVPSEGVGSVLLKPLYKAIEDKDNIYAVIKGMAVNHDGKTSGYSVSNPNAQCKAVSEALKKAAVNPRTIGYIEAHGTGTSLGDPIEIRGLTKAYQQYTKDNQFCRIGSVKTNIGHAEAAAGIASITKAILQLKHKTLVPSLLSEKLNTNIQFEQTPFQVQHGVEEFKPLTTTGEMGEIVSHPLRIGISSFGAGGSNAHVILEEYKGRQETGVIFGKEEELILLSARNEERLRAYCREFLLFLEDTKVRERDLDDWLLAFMAEVIGVQPSVLKTEMDLEECGFDIYSQNKLLEKISDTLGITISLKELSQHNSAALLAQYLKIHKEIPYDRLEELLKPEKDNTENLSLKSMAYTLQTGRYEAEGCRMAVKASSITELRVSLQMFLYQNIIDGKVYLSKKGMETEEVKKEELMHLIQNRELDTLARMWCTGTSIPWERLYDRKPSRISLPKYPFEKLNCWYIKTEDSTVGHKPLHPMLDSNVSTFGGSICFEKNFSDLDFYIRDHEINGKRLLPGAAYLEMACAGASLAAEGSAVYKLKNISWLSPLQTDSHTVPARLLLKEGQGKAEFKIISSKDGKEQLHSQGTVAYSEEVIPEEYLDLEEIQERLETELIHQDIYRYFNQTGYNYGDNLRTVLSAGSNQKEILAKIALNKDALNQSSDFLLHPGLLDGAFQCIATRTMAENTAGEAVIPFALEELEIREPLEKACMVYITNQSGEFQNSSRVQKYDLCISNMEGRILVKITGLTGRKIKEESQESGWKDSYGKPGTGKENTLELLKRLEIGELSIEEVENLLGVVL